MNWSLWIAVFTPETIIELSFLVLSLAMLLALPAIIVERKEVEKYCGPSEWRVGKVFRK